MKKGFSVLLNLLFVVVLIGVTSGAYYIGSKASLIKTSVIPTGMPTVSKSPQITSSKNEQPLFSGTVQKINKDLGLFKLSDADKENGVPDMISYFSAGVFNRGEYTGYTRILAIRPSEGPGPSLRFILATKDFTSFVLDDPLAKTANYPLDDWDNPYMYLDKNKISKATTLESNHPQTISIKPPFKLIRQDAVLLEFKKTGTKDKNGNDEYEETPISDFSPSLALSNSQTQLALFAGSVDRSNFAPQGDKEKIALATEKKYLNKTSLVHGKDSTGLTYSYLLSTQQDVDSYLSRISSEQEKLITYKKQVALYNAGKLTTYPEYPKAASFPGLRFTQTSASLPSGYYNTYDSAFPGACGGAQSTYIVDSLTDVDLESVASTSDYPLFTLKDAKHPLNLLAYQVKTDQGEESFKGVNDGKSIPSYDTYIAKYPLLFFKDVWGRWVVVGEFDYKLMGGCGKPVVYLYPEKPTEVHLSFGSQVALNTQIPIYHDGWLVRAHPNGNLVDLQPQYTNCSHIDTSKFGSEYAKNACATNSYPYIYWSGKSITNEYPKATGGWIVKRNELAPFLSEKLDEMGLSKGESTDMISYWIPQMIKKNAPYYRVSFLQTQEMNAFIPIQVNPAPDTVLRVFLDWNPVYSKPIETLMPQQLEKVNRNGFTLVEWGGLQ